MAGVSALQRKESVDAGRRSHADGRQAVVGLAGLRRFELPLHLAQRS